MRPMRDALTAAGSPMQAQALAQSAMEKAPPTVSGEDPEAIKKAAQEFESLFVHQLFKSMRATIPKGGLTDAGFGGEVFTDMLDQEYAQTASRTGQIGMADLIAGQLGLENSIRPALNSRRMRATRAYSATAAQAAARAADKAAAPRNDLPGGWIVPVEGRKSSAFGMRKLADEDHARMHKGLDIAAPTGTPIRAAQGGEVIFAGRKGGYGNTVILDHGDGLTTLYAHAAAIDVAAGDRVDAGAVIASVGSTGRSTGPHLHFELRRDGDPVDPAPALGLDR